MRKLKLVILSMPIFFGSVCQTGYLCAQASRNKGISGDLHDVFFLNDNNGWCYSYGTGSIYATSNGAMLWKKIAQLDSIYFEQIQFLDRNTGFICGEKGKIYKTHDGGHSWENIEIQTKPDENLLLYAMFFSSPGKGTVGGMRITNDRKSRQYEVYQTIDGGVTWEKLDNTPSVMFFKFISVGQDSVLAAGSNSIYALNPKSKVFKTIYQNKSNGVGDIRDIQIIDPHAILAVSFNGYLLKSADNGATWIETKASDERLRGLYFLSTSEGWIIGNKGTLLYTRDAGVTWQKQGTSNADLHRITASKNFIQVVGKKSTVLTWKKKL